MRRFEKVALQQTGGSKQVKAWGVLASAWKQVAQFDAKAEGREEDFEDALRKARDYYFKCYQSGVREAWPLVQYLALTMGPGQLTPAKEGEEKKQLRRIRRQLRLAKAIARDNLEWGRPQQKVWAYASLVELAILELWEGKAKVEQLESRARQHLQELFAITRHNLYDPKEAVFDERSTLRELKRYAAWDWGNDAMRALSTTLSRIMEDEYGVQVAWVRTE